MLSIVVKFEKTLNIECVCFWQLLFGEFSKGPVEPIIRKIALCSRYSFYIIKVEGAYDGIGKFISRSLLSEKITMLIMPGKTAKANITKMDQ